MTWASTRRRSSPTHEAAGAAARAVWASAVVGQVKRLRPSKGNTPTELCVRRPLTDEEHAQAEQRAQAFIRPHVAALRAALRAR